MKMDLLWSATVLILGLASLCQSQTATLDLTLLETAVNTNKDENITRTEVESFYTMLAGMSTSVTRCAFLGKMVDNFMGSPLRMSALYDLMQTDDGQILSLAELRKAFLGNADLTVVYATVFRSNINSLMERVTTLLAKPYQSTTGPTYWKYSDFEVDRLATVFDQDGNGIITKDEINIAMRNLDGNGDLGIRRCEFVDAMITFKAHGVTANKLYDVIFKNRDVSWADVDGDFLMLQMNEYGEDLVITKEELVDFFTLQNTLAAGLTVDAGGKVVGDGNSASMTQFSLLCVVSSLVAYFTMISTL